MPISAETFIAKRLYSAESASDRARSAARPAVRVALAGIVIGVMVMLVTICVVVGFKTTVTSKVAGFGAHIQVVNYESNNTYELRPITISDSLVQRLRRIPNVASVHEFATKPGIIKTDEAFQGIVLKSTPYWDFFAANLVSGSLPENPNEVLISTTLARLLELADGETFLCYFVEDNVRVRKFTISGIYSTGFSEFDDRFVISGMDVVRRLNGWSEQQASGLEILLSDLQQLDETADRVYFATANRLDEEGNGLYTLTLKDMNPQIFAWLDLLNMNVIVIILLMLAVSCFTIVSALIILILDSIRLIGTLKALGATNRFVRRIFITEAAMLVGKGMIWGNILGLTLCAAQYIWHLIPLSAETYYVNYVPVAFPWVAILALNVGIFVVAWLVMLAPSAIVTHIHPAKVMHFE